MEVRPIDRFAACAAATIFIAACAVEPTTDDSTTTTLTTATTVSATSTTTTTTLPPVALADLTVDLALVAEGFTQPVLALGRTGDSRLFVIDQRGTVESIPWSGTDGEWPLAPTRVLDISSQVGFGAERGLLGAAFHPTDPDRLFLHYSRASDGAGIIEEYRLPGDSAVAEPNPVRTLLVVPQPAPNHNGGMIAFGPDAYLYIGLGDGGGGGDPFRTGQDPTTLLGSLLRIDVDSGDPYAIPADNPFAGGEGGAPEVWAYGLRNPWRFSFDGNHLWIGDVGQGSWEEIDVVDTSNAAGTNFGWPIKEGTSCYEGPADRCQSDEFADPIYEYTIRGVNRCAVIGGYVYRGDAFPALEGAYLFADHCTGEVFAIRTVDGAVTEERMVVQAPTRVTSLGSSLDGELFVITTGGVYLVTASGG